MASPFPLRNVIRFAVETNSAPSCHDPGRRSDFLGHRLSHGGDARRTIFVVGWDLDSPLFALDRVWVSRPWGVAAVSTLQAPAARTASDHLPIIATLRPDDS